METNQNQEPKQVDTTQSELDALMAMYSNPAKKVEETQPVAGSTISPQAPSPAITSTDPEAPYGRYQRGKKKGQPRTAPFISAKALPAQPVQVQTQPQTAKLSGMLIDGGLFLTLINMAVPLLITVIHNAMEKDKKKHIDPKKLKLSNDQIKELDPVCDAVMKQVSLTGNPLVILLIGLATAYGLNFMAIKLEQK